MVGLPTRLLPLKIFGASQVSHQISQFAKSVTTRQETWLPFTERLIIKPDLAYIAKSALLTRVLVGFSRSWLNKDVDDPKLSPPQIKQAFLESCFKELFGTPSNMIAFHLASDVAGAWLQKSGFVPRQLAASVPQVSAADMAKVNQLLHQFMGQKGWVGKAVFDTNLYGLTPFKQMLQNNQMGHLINNPAFDQAMVKWFKRLKMGGALCFVAQMIANIAYGGFFVQQFNDRVVAPVLEKSLYRPQKNTLSKSPLQSAGGLLA